MTDGAIVSYNLDTKSTASGGGDLNVGEVIDFGLGGEIFC